MKHTNAQLAMMIIQCLEELELNSLPNVSGNKCRMYVKRITKGKPLSSLPNETLHLLHNMFHGILSR